MWRRRLAATGWSVAVVAIALLWLFPDALSRIRALTSPSAEMAADCALTEGPCTATFGDGVAVTLWSEPGEAVATEPVRLVVGVDGGPEPHLVELQGADMNMGLVRVELAPTADGRWEGTARLPGCTRERMAWRADVLLGGRVAGFTLWSRLP